MITKEDLKIILQEGEGYKVEFKEDLSGIDKEMDAFANSSGGRIFLGINDKNEVQGIKISNRLRAQIQDIANNCDPKIKIILEELSSILVINVKEGDDKPYKCTSGFYKRIGSNSQKLSRNEILDLFKSEGKVRFDELIEPKFKYPKDSHKEKLNRFLSLADISKSTPLENILVNLAVAQKQEGILYFNNAGVLFFAKEPQKFIPWSVFTVALFKDREGVDIIDRKEINGSLFEIVEQVMDFVKLYAKVAYRFTGKPQREEIYEYPFEAIREAVINSVMHKYYFEHGHNNILRFLPDRIRIENFWVKPAHFKLGETVFRRNPLIVDLFARIHFGEKMGTGMNRMRDICKAENAPLPKIELNENYFYITFAPTREYLKMAGQIEDATEKVTKRLIDRLGVKLGVKLGVNEKRILEQIIENKFITIVELAKMLNISTTATENNLKKLKAKRVLKRVGSDKSGYWEILKL